jgi:plastocyanin
MNGRWLGLGIVAIAALGASVPAALADEQIQAAPTNRYTTPSPTMDQGERLTFANADLAAHNVTATQNGTDGKSLFASELIGTGRTSFVEGSQYLVTGMYAFLCSVHPFMTGTLTVTSAGTPVPRPGLTADTTAPALALRISSTRVKRLVVRATVDEPSTVSLKATARAGGRTITVGRATAAFDAAGTRAVTLKVTAAGKRALRGRSTLKITVRGTARDADGNTRSATVSGRLRG